MSLVFSLLHQGETFNYIQKAMNSPYGKVLEKAGTLISVADIGIDSIEAVQNLPESASANDIVQEVMVQSGGSATSSGVGFAAFASGAEAGFILSWGNPLGAAFGGVLGTAAYVITGSDDYVEKIAEESIRWLLSVEANPGPFEWEAQIAP